MKTIYRNGAGLWMVAATPDDRKAAEADGFERVPATIPNTDLRAFRQELLKHAPGRYRLANHRQIAFRPVDAPCPR